jgi:hypothetical protein
MALGMGLSQRRACELVEITEVTLRRWKDDDPEFAAKVNAARAKTVLNLASKAIALTDASSEAVKLGAVKWLLGVLAEEYRVDPRGDQGDRDREGEMADYTYL